MKMQIAILALAAAALANATEKMSPTAIYLTELISPQVGYLGLVVNPRLLTDGVVAAPAIEVVETLGPQITGNGQYINVPMSSYSLLSLNASGNPIPTNAFGSGSVAYAVAMGLNSDGTIGVSVCPVNSGTVANSFLTAFLGTTFFSLADEKEFVNNYFSQSGARPCGATGQLLYILTPGGTLQPDN